MGLEKKWLPFQGRAVHYTSSLYSTTIKQDGKKGPI
jgi:hypothetical protein